ncbi:MAG: N-6 DNA methylase [Clostridia bacterium]|nr:N-6 DNA methylase [Clostridia bacterium]
MNAGTDENMPEMLSLKEACRMLGISLATGRNWVRLGRLMPAGKEGRSPVFDLSAITALKASLETGTVTALKSRRNKKYVSGNGIYGSYLDPDSSGVRSVAATLEYIEGSNAEMTDSLIRTILAGAAVQMLSAEHGSGMLLGDFLARRADCRFPCAELIADLLEGIRTEEYVSRHPGLYEIPYAADGSNDVLGLLYISCLNAGSRKAAGAYYTPACVVDAIISGLDTAGLENAGILDPCCGTGNFLLRLPDAVPPENVYGNDLDAVSVMLARISLALKYRVQDTGILYRNITVSDYLTDYDSPGPDCIIGNPPWGYDFTPDETARLDGLFRTACGSGTESYDVFIEKSLGLLRPGGTMSFVLPEAVLNVKSHMAVRECILENAEIRGIEYLGNVFSGVQCPCVAMRLARTEGGTPSDPGTGEFICTGTKVVPLEGDAFVCTGRRMTAECFRFGMNSEEYAVLQKIGSVPGARYLKGNADFALGIVTGNNKREVSSVKTDSNEMVLRGSDLRKFRFLPSQSYITFTPEKFQQAAPEEYYRAPEKLLYRFICSRLVFAYDTCGTLSLNSCNILIPGIPGLSCRYVMAVLNSRAAQFWFTGMHDSVKVLRSHIEGIPIPYADESTQRTVEGLADRIRSAGGAGEIQGLYDELDGIMAGLYGLTAEEYAAVRKRTDRGNLFLV